MNILVRLYWFLSWLIITGIITIIVLLVLRLIANQVDLNPFSWSYRSIRRVSDPILLPVRAGLLRLGVNPKYAPLVAILLAVLMGWFAIQLLTSIVNTLVGVVYSLADANPVALIGYILYGLVGLYILLIFLRVIFSWGATGYSNRFMRFLVNTTEPLLAPLRRLVMLPVPVDLSPIFAFIILWIMQMAIAGTLLRGMRITFVG